MPKPNKELDALQHITMNLAPSVRYETFQGREYVVAPTAMMTEGVHNGSNGPLFYGEKDMARDVGAWNTRPVVVYHPSINGEGVSACDPAILEQQQVGLLMNSRYDNKLRTEAWLELSRLEKVDPRILTALESGEIMEVSTGLFTDNILDPGTFNGETYDFVATNHRPDHLAILPDKIGACSIAKGAGMLQLNALADDMPELDVERMHAVAVADTARMVANAMSHNDTYTLLSTAVKSSHGTDAFVLDVYSKYFVFESGSHLWRMDYKVTKAKAELIGAPEEVFRQVMYRAPSGALIGNQAQIKEQTMPKKVEEIVDGLIANTATQWSTEDRDFLLTQNEEQLAKFEPVENMKGEKPDFGKKKKADGEEEEDDDDMKGKKKAVENAAAAGAIQITPEAYIGQAPAPIQNMLNAGLAAYNVEKARLIGCITANAQNAFTQEQLEAKDNPELAVLAQLAAPAAPVTANQNQPLYAGQAAPAYTQNAEPEAGLAIPVMNFEN